MLSPAIYFYGIVCCVAPFIVLFSWHQLYKWISSEDLKEEFNNFLF